MTADTLNPQKRHWTATFDWGTGRPTPAPIGGADTEQATAEAAYGTLSSLLTGAENSIIELFYDGELVRSQRLHRDGPTLTPLYDASSTDMSWRALDSSSARDHHCHRIARKACR